MNAETLYLSDFTYSVPHKRGISTFVQDESFPQHVSKLYEREQQVYDFYFTNKQDGGIVEAWISNQVDEEPLILCPRTSRQLNENILNRSRQINFQDKSLLPTSPDMYVFGRSVLGVIRLAGIVEISLTKTKFRSKVHKMQNFFNSMSSINNTHRKSIASLVNPDSDANCFSLTENPFVVFLCTDTYSRSAIGSYWHKFESERQETDVPFNVYVDGANLLTI